MGLGPAGLSLATVLGPAVSLFKVAHPSLPTGPGGHLGIAVWAQVVQLNTGMGFGDW